MKKNKSNQKTRSFIKSHLNQILLTLYLGTVFNIFIFLLAADYITLSPLYILALITISMIIYVLTFFLCGVIIKKLFLIKTPSPFSFPSRQQKRKTFIIFFLIAFSISMFWFLAYNPGGFSPDSAVQYNQAISGEYSDWHPALHTFLFFTIPLSIFHNISAIVICQIILFCIVLTYATITIIETADKKWGIITFLLVILNPWVLDELMFPWTNVAFGIMILLITTFCIKIYKTNGAWCQKKTNLIILAIAIGCATIFRHNGILYTAPALLALFFFMTKSDWRKLLIAVFVFVFLIKIPFYSILNVTAPGSRTTEITGLPMTILANVTKETPDALNENALSFMHQIAPQEKYEAEYIAGDFNSIKFTSNTAPIEEAGIPAIIGYTTDAFFKSPKASLVALFKLTSVVYGIDGNLPIHNTPHINANINDQQITYHGNTFLRSAIDLYRAIFRNSFLKYFGFIGITILLIITFVLSKNEWQYGGWKKILLCSPILFFDFGTMLLLTGPEPRFFFANFIAYPSIIVLSIINQKGIKNVRKKLN